MPGRRRVRARHSNLWKGVPRETSWGDAVSLSFAALMTANRTRHVRYFAPGQRPWDDADWVLAIGGEVGEACNIVKKLNRARQGMLGNGGATIETLTQDLGAELADVVIYAVVVAGIKQHVLPWHDFRGLRKSARGQRDIAVSSSWRQIEGLLIAAADLADVVGIDLGAAVVGKFNATSIMLGFPERL